MMARRPVAGSLAKTTCSCSAPRSKTSAVVAADMAGAHFLFSATGVVWRWQEDRQGWRRVLAHTVARALRPPKPRSTGERAVRLPVRGGCALQRGDRDL